MTAQEFMDQTYWTKSDLEKKQKDLDIFMSYLLNTNLSIEEIQKIQDPDYDSSKYSVNKKHYLTRGT